MADPAEPAFLTAGAAALCNRLRKNLAHRSKRARRERLDAYRLYDADLPEYAAAVDVYGAHAHVQEYAPPSDVEAELAAERFADVLTAVAYVLGLPAEKVVAKTRRRQSEGAQYERLGESGREFVVREGDLALRVNLHDYLDTGLFLDHQPTRSLLLERARGKRFLNLFCYTASASVAAGVGGAASTLSIDKSNAYLAWAARNLAENGLSPPSHRLEREDVVEWLDARPAQEFDLVFLDPPTYSRSKDTRSDFDVQRQHAWLIERCMLRVAEGGEVWFSCNRRGFALDSSLSRAFDVRDWTRRTTPPEFDRAPPPHRCWRIARRPDESVR